MKASTIIIAAVISLQFQILFAGNPELKVYNNVTNNEIAKLKLIAMAPVIPMEADFNDVIPEPGINMSILAPVTPAEADFNDNAPDITINTINLAPETPSEADFAENDSYQQENISLIPVTPAEADFE